LKPSLPWNEVVWCNFNVISALRGDYPAYLIEPRLQVPAVLELDRGKEFLLYRWSSTGGTSSVAPGAVDPRPAEGMAALLTAFVGLRTAEDVLAFARRWGPFQLCEHDMPFRHAHPRAAFRVSMFACTEQVWPEEVSGQEVFFEPIASWLSRARRVQAFLKLGRAIRFVRPRLAEEWQTFLNDEPQSEEALEFVADQPGEWKGHGLEADRGKLVEELSRWTQIAGGDYLPVWEGPRPGLRLSGGLLAVLCQQMFKTLAEADSEVACDGCGALYKPTRRPAWNRNAYCPACRDKVGPAARQARHRSRISL
jgi:hypothetical protein